MVKNDKFSIMCVSSQFKNNIISIIKQKPNTCIGKKTRGKVFFRLFFSTPGLPKVSQEPLNSTRREPVSSFSSHFSHQCPAQCLAKSTVFNNSHSINLSLIIGKGRRLCQGGSAFICFLYLATFSF